jgi:hypothetical protein
MFFTPSRRIRFYSVIAALAVALMFAPSAFARGGHHGGGHHGGGHYGGGHSNWGISLGFSGPGYSIGYSDCRGCGGGYVSGSYYGGYSSGYYAPTYYPSYYDYYPSYGSAYYGYPVYRDYRHHRSGPRRTVRYDGYYDRHYRGDHDRDDRRHSSRGYGDHDRGYARRSAYYDRRN